MLWAFKICTISSLLKNENLAYFKIRLALMLALKILIKNILF